MPISISCARKSQVHTDAKRVLCLPGSCPPLGHCGTYNPKHLCWPLAPSKPQGSCPTALGDLLGHSRSMAAQHKESLSGQVGGGDRVTSSEEAGVCAGRCDRLHRSKAEALPLAP